MNAVIRWNPPWLPRSISIDMYSIYNDWLLVIAAYNCGAEMSTVRLRVPAAKTFWEISPYLPRETRGYVPAFIAVTYLMNYSSEQPHFCSADDQLLWSGYSDGR